MGGFVIDKKDLTQALKEVTPCASKDEKLAPINQVQIAIIEGVPYFWPPTGSSASRKDSTQ